MRHLRPLLVVALVLCPAVATGQDLPAGLADLLREATPQERETLENVAKRKYPEQRQAIDDLVERIKDEEKARTGKLSVVKGWTGEGSLGGNISSGNTDEWNVSAALNVKRKGPRWEHRVEFQADLSDDNGNRTQERVSTAYRARRDFDKSRFFTFGSLSYDRNPFQGINHRFTESAGAGYEIMDRDDLDWDIYAGPSLRQTEFTDARLVDQLGLFAATDFKWEITDTLTIREYAGMVLAEENQSFKSTTSLTKNLYGRLSARADFTIDTETNPPEGSEETDVYSRISLVYDF